MGVEDDIGDAVGRTVIYRMIEGYVRRKLTTGEKQWVNEEFELDPPAINDFEAFAQRMGDRILKGG